MRAPPLRPEDVTFAAEREPVIVPLTELRATTAKHYQTAHIATDLVQDADFHVHSGSRISVVGNDLPNAADASYIWVKDQPEACAEGVLPRWLRRGARVRYFAISPQEDALKNLRELIVQFPGRLEVRRPSAQIAGDRFASRLVELWKTFHVVIFENEPQLWVECHHAACEKEAHDCYYFAPELAKASPFYQLYREEFELMFERFGTPVA
ncbi:MAG TPA: hypothetical protein VGO11_11280 [Chthoniobacteraceae bacterium]|jgi:hypothetical protein|nr:hypothetical protein [Chthoniobacteraceae bacterium]